ncbi:hypothetical protein G6011_07829 [Alternaria panax]|uniref:Uncharacterized protein n=1 Tax=Alternaria panax TaxID=48097 RepID=A0AAD4F9E4_9PLEO|nr:hypothetical protein G6011_07829 [Alternaria panax]
MGFLEDARRLAGDFGQEAAQHVASAAGETWNHGSAIGREMAKHAGPVAKDTRKHLEELSKEAGRRAAPIAHSASRHAMSLAQSAFNNVNRGIRALPQVHDQDFIKEFDWKFIDDFGEDMAKRLGSTADDFWQKLSSGDLLKDISPASWPTIEFTQKDLSGFSENIKEWILSNPGQFATLLACIASGPIVAAVTPAMLGLVGFTPIGIAGGSMASAFQATVGPIATGSAFAILTSAGMGGYGLAIVQAIAIGSSVTGTCGTAAVAFLNVVKVDEQCRKEKTE